MLKLKILEEAELGAKFFANIRLALDKEELARKKPYNYIMDWPRNLKIILGKDLEPYGKKGMEVERELPSFQNFLITRQEYKKLKKEGNVLDYARFKNLRNYFCIKRLQELPDKYKEKLKISLATRETTINEKNLNTNNEDFILEIRNNEDCEWCFNVEISGEREFKTKIPSFYGSFVFINLGMFKNYPITLKKRRDVDSEKRTDERSIKKRGCIREEDLSKYHKVASVTYKNLRTLVDDEKLLKKCKKSHLIYNKRRNTKIEIKNGLKEVKKFKD